MILGVICEFNPFHKGHKYLINTVKNDKSDIVICAMSGNFVQRGEFAVYDKYKRAKKALENGADIVIEIPTICSTLSAGGFAKAGTELLEATGVCTHLAFGAECDDINELYSAVNLIKENDVNIKEELKKGISYPAARQNAVDLPLLKEPNNILAVEYLMNTRLTPIAVKRIGKGHDTNDEIYSASQIRKNLNPNEISSIYNCESAVLSKLRLMSANDFVLIDDVSEGLENRLVDVVRKSTSLNEIYDGIKTKRYTHSRIRRIVLRSYLSINKYTPKTPQYLHILGFTQKGREILPEIKKNTSLPIISRYADIKNLPNNTAALYEEECGYTDLYNLGYKKPLPCGTEQRNKLIIL